MEYRDILVVIKETSVFTKIISELLLDDSYRKLQVELIASPKLGDLIQGSGGIRKLHWSIPGAGKRGANLYALRLSKNKTRKFNISSIEIVKGCCNRGTITWISKCLMN